MNNYYIFMLRLMGFQCFRDSPLIMGWETGTDGGQHYWLPNLKGSCFTPPSLTCACEFTLFQVEDILCHISVASYIYKRHVM